MTIKRFILNADGFGMSKSANKAVLDGYHNGFLKSASLCANGNAFNGAVNEIIPECPNLSVGIHLNLTKGNSLTKAPLLTNKKGQFNNNFAKLLINSSDKDFLQQIEFEFRTQIETILNYTKADHIDSLKNIHAIPALFEIAAKLALEYGIPSIRTNYEEFYFVPSLKKHLNLKYLKNIFNVLILNFFTKTNRIYAIQHGLKTNDYSIGTIYNGIMDNEAIAYGLEIIDDSTCIVEAVIHPLQTSNKKRNYREFMITQDKSLKDKIDRLGFDIVNWKINL